MKKEVREELFNQSVRWCNNMLVECISTHGQHLSDHKRKCLRTALSAIQDAMGPEPEDRRVEEGQVWKHRGDGTTHTVQKVVTEKGATMVFLGVEHEWLLSVFLKVFDLVDDGKTD